MRHEGKRKVVLKENESVSEGVTTELDGTTDYDEVALDTSLTFEGPDEHEVAQSSGFAMSQVVKRKPTAVPSDIDSAISKFKKKIAESANGACDENMFDTFGKSVAA